MMLRFDARLCSGKQTSQSLHNGYPGQYILETPMANDKRTSLSKFKSL